MRIVCLSDTHARHGRVDVPDGDLLIHAGDITGRGSLETLRDFDAFLAGLPHPHKVVIAGNHDFSFERQPAEAQACIQHALYLEDAAAEVGGVRVYGSPWQPWFHNWAFNLERGAALREKWDRIPEDTDVLITHGPPQGILDRTHDGEDAGCEDLRVAVERVRPRLHVFGHIHEAAGVERHGATLFVNASTCCLRYEPFNAPIVVDLDVDDPERPAEVSTLG